LVFAFAPDILGCMNDETRPILWVILPPQAREKLTDLVGEEDALDERFARQLFGRLTRDQPPYKDRIFVAAKAIGDRLGADPGWGDWPSDPEECLAVGMILGLQLERDLPEMLCELPEEELYPSGEAHG
jgi:hypothetical protein